MQVLGVPYEVRRVEHVHERYDEPVIYLHRADGVAGHLLITGPGADELQVGKTYTIHETEPE